MTSASEHSQQPLHIVILAAGEGTRMRSHLAKVLQPLGGKPMLAHVLGTAQALAPERIHIVYGYQGEQVKQQFAHETELNWIEQAEQRGTGHAVISALPHLPDSARILILYGDAPLIPRADLQQLIKRSTALAVLSTTVDDPTGYGRLLRDSLGSLKAIVEHKDATQEQLEICEINTGVLTADVKQLRVWLGRLHDNNAQGEFLLTDIIAHAAQDEVHIEVVQSDNAAACLGANDRIQLAAMEKQFQHQQRMRLMQQGLSFADPDSVQIRGEIKTGQDTFVDINVVLEGQVVLGDGVRIGSGCVIKDAQLAAGTIVHPHCVIEGAITHGPCQIGPFARLRPGSDLGTGSKVGNFVEMKKTRLGAASKASHLSYLGDSVIGENVNIGAGTITCNYDGVNKFKTTIEDDAFIGSNSALVAPVTIGSGSLVGAGSVITQDVPDQHLAVARGKQRNIRRRNKSS